MVAREHWAVALERRERERGEREAEQNVLQSYNECS